MCCCCGGVEVTTCIGRDTCFFGARPRGTLLFDTITWVKEYFLMLCEQCFDPRRPSFLDYVGYFVIGHIHIADRVVLGVSCWAPVK